MDKLNYFETKCLYFQTAITQAQLFKLLARLRRVKSIANECRLHLEVSEQDVRILDSFCTYFQSFHATGDSLFSLRITIFINGVSYKRDPHKLAGIFFP